MFVTIHSNASRERIIELFKYALKEGEHYVCDILTSDTWRREITDTPPEEILKLVPETKFLHCVYAYRDEEVDIKGFDHHQLSLNVQAPDGNSYFIWIRIRWNKVKDFLKPEEYHLH